MADATSARKSDKVNATRPALTSASASRSPKKRRISLVEKMKTPLAEIDALKELANFTDPESHWVANKEVLLKSCRDTAERKCRECALTTLAKLANHPNNKEPIWEEAETVLLDASRLTVDADRECREQALRALANLGAHANNSVPVWDAAQGLLLKASQSMDGKERKCRIFALRALANIAAYGSNEARIWKAAQKVLLKASQLTDAEDRKCRTYALAALANFAAHNNNKAPIWDAAYDVLLKASQLMAGEDRDCRTYALRALSNVATHSDKKVPIWKTAGDVLIETSCLLTDAPDRDSREELLLTLARLAEHPANQLPIWEAAKGVLIEASKLLGSANDKCRKHALLALYSLAEHPDNRKPIWSAVGSALHEMSLRVSSEENHAQNILDRIAKDDQVCARYKYLASGSVSAGSATSADAEASHRGTTPMDTPRENAAAEDLTPQNSGKKRKALTSTSSVDSSDDPTNTDTNDTDLDNDAEDEAKAQPMADYINRAIDETVPIPEPSGVTAPPIEFDWVPPAENNIIHLTQEHEARKLYEKVSAQLAKCGQPLDKFTQFKLLIQNPNLNSLYNQNMSRLKEFILQRQSKKSRFFADVTSTTTDSSGICSLRTVQTESMVNKNQPEGRGKESNELRKRWLRDIEANPNTLFLVVHDEAHYEATKEGGADLFVNNPIVRESVNVVTLFVSATPYNLLTRDSQIPKENVHIWNYESSEEEIEPGAKRYFGLKFYGDPTRMVSAGDKNQDDVRPGSMCEVDAAFQDATLKVQSSVKSAKAGGRDVKNVLPPLQTLIGEYVEAIGSCTEIDGCPRYPRESTKPRKSMTHCMVRHLINGPLEEGSGGRGIMILIRQPGATGRKIFEKIKAARDAAGLRSRFAVLLDLTERNASLSAEMQQHNPDQFDRMKVCNGGKAPVITQYSHLNNVNCVLILCEKGKMGDSFPPSLRYYDLRLRYSSRKGILRAAAEQDVGRACRWASDESELPIVLLSKPFFKLLKKGRNDNSRGLLLCEPDRTDKMLQHKKGKIGGDSAYPTHDNEFATECYRNHWRAKSCHFDDGGKKSDGWCDNPRRFLLFGRPQIGKTGVFLHLAQLLWNATEGCAAGPAQEEPQLVPIPEDIFGDDTEDDDVEDKSHPDVNDPAFAPLPLSEYVSGLTFKDRTQLIGGKYGAPSDDALWKWYVTDANRAQHRDASLSSTAGAARGTAVSNAASCIPSDPEAGAAKNGEEVAETSVARPMWEAKYRAKPHAVAQNAVVPIEGDANGAQRFKFTLDNVDGEPEALELWAGENSVKNWWVTPGLGSTAPPTLRPNTDSVNSVRFPIFMPSAGRSSTALVDLSAAIPNCRYNQIIVVKANEADEYRRGRPHFTFLVLPESADTLGIGASRFWTVAFAQKVTGNTDFPFILMLDDNVDYWKGRTLQRDPRPQFGVQRTKKAQFTDISLERVLCDLQRDDDYVKRELSSFSVVGFARSAGFKDGSARWAYKRGHVYSAVILNVKQLEDIGVSYNPRLHLWEDLDLNERVNAGGGLLAKCQRYLQVKRNIGGGTDYMVARPDHSLSSRPQTPSPVHPPAPRQPSPAGSEGDIADSKLRQLIESAKLKGLTVDKAVGLIEDVDGDVDVLLSFTNRDDFKDVLIGFGFPNTFDIQRLWSIVEDLQGKKKKSEQ